MLTTAVLLVSVGAKVVQTQDNQKVAPARGALDVLAAALLPQEGAAFQGAVQPLAAPGQLRRAPAPVALLPELTDHLPQLLEHLPAGVDLDPGHLPTNLLAEVLDADGERNYGAVDAPGWVAPLGGVAAIGTALLPVLLAPGDDAFRSQQANEEEVKAQFGKGRGNLKRKK